MKTTKNHKHIKVILIIFCFSIIFASLSAYLLNKSSAASYQPLEAGVNFSAGWSDHSDADNVAIIDKLAAAGVKQVRIDIGWSTIEESGDVYGGASDPTATYNPSAPLNQWYVKKIDKAVNYANSKGINVLGIWWTTPNWNQDGGPQNNYEIRPAGYPTYPEYAESIEWAAKYWAGRIDDWEIWNEADPSQKFWQAPDGSYGGTQQYAELLKVAYPAAKKGNPNANVLNSGPATLDDVWISQLYGYGIKGYFDTLAVHAYEAPSDADPLISNGSKVWNYLHMPAVRQVMINNGDADKPVWITEMGWSSHTNETLVTGSTVPNWQWGVTEQQQGEYLVKALDYAKNNWPYVEVLIHYMDRNRASAGGDANTARHQKNFGLLYADNTPKQSYTILSNYLNTQPQPPTAYPDIDANLSNASLSKVFDMQNPPVNEASGLAVSQGMYLTHNDSGGTASLYAFNKNSQLIATINVPGASAVDWEDIAVVPGTGTDDVYIADIGNNAGTRTDLKIYKFNIPSIDKTKFNQIITAQNVVSYPISYSDSNNDAETLAIHPITKKIYIVSKRGTPYIYESPVNLSTSSNNVFQVKNAMPVQYATAGDISRDGKYFVVTTSNNARIWEITNGDVLGAITANPSGYLITPPSLAQLEGITFTPDGKHIVFNTEYGVPSPVWAMPNPRHNATLVIADINKDSKVDVFDLSILLSKWNTSDAGSDLNKDSVVNVFDLSILLANWTK